MCRHLGYIGPPISVGELLTRGGHSLYAQSWAPRDMRGGGTINADGFGVAWWSAADRLVRYRNAAPIWTDPAVTEVLGELRAGAILAAVRSATVGMPVERAACAPFVDERWAFSLNGLVDDWRATLAGVRDLDFLDLESATDAAALWSALRDDLAGTPPEQALAALCRDILARAPGSRLNLLLGDGATIWATTVTHALSALVTADVAVLASEPYDDDPRWRPLPDRHLITARPGQLALVPLEGLA